jgi:hypothetical protein
LRKKRRREMRSIGREERRGRRKKGNKIIFFLKIY